VPTASPTKADLRARFRAARRALSPVAWAERSAAIAARAIELPEVDRARCVLGYWPIADEREVDPRTLVRLLAMRGVLVALPVVTSFAPAAPGMEARRLVDPAALRPNRWGLLEPVHAPRIDRAALDLIVVPALGAGRDGHRVGHGFGYYDAFLRGLDVPTVALVYDACLVDAVPADAHDVPVSVVVTETTTLRPAAPSA
jgi:5-formyltetrahydrofolate cyclo-ligase